MLCWDGRCGRVSEERCGVRPVRHSTGVNINFGNRMLAGRVSSWVGIPAGSVGLVGAILNMASPSSGVILGDLKSMGGTLFCRAECHSDPMSSCG